ncbi:probable alpha alpha-trehalose-phosphate synthase [UDP-forming] 8 [Phtheirospermum japonicum]|uniref:Probable alpha alpha-trehalose-phosphate synthase [UDP-forming] 8 n=1 Tax=Phtheirospermum japonicum TaxID=374723 RepID=A0A830BY58_9LAMI|nr:probable alpha alpha-trehalose-phosphate synthase [UDP-forming] 8 [Phtheirospermum japonicum]
MAEPVMKSYTEATDVLEIERRKCFSLALSRCRPCTWFFSGQRNAGPSRECFSK